MEVRPAAAMVSIRRLALLVALPLLMLGVVHLFSQQYGTATPPQVLRLTEARLLPGDALDPAQIPGALPDARSGARLRTGPASADSAASSVVSRPLSPTATPTPMPSTMPTTPAVPLAPGHVVALPVQIHDTDAPGPLWLALDFHLDRSAEAPYWLVIQHRPAATVYLDGQLIATSSPGSGYASEDEDDLAQRGLLLAGRRLQVSIPPAMLPAGEHRLSLRLARPGFEGAGLSAPLLGPSAQIRALQEGRRFWQVIRVTTALAGIVIGAFMLMVWLALRQEWLYGVTGLFCLCTALLLSPYLLNGALFPAPWWRVTLDLADVLSKAGLLFLVARLSGIGARWPEKMAMAYLVLGTVIDGAAAFLGWSWTDFHHPWPWWALGSRAVVLGAAAVLAARAALATPRYAHLVGACAVALSAWVWLYVSWFALVLSKQMSVVDINVVGHAVLIAIAGVALQRRFVGSLRDEAMARIRLEQALDARTRELQDRWEDLQDSERQRTAAQERERLLQEMHDGLGSQLVTARLCAERGVTSQSLVGLLDECIREMRLTVDALAVTDGDLTLLLANLRHRMAPRLQDAGLELDWQLTDIPLLPTLRGTGGRELIRIVQEALSNVIHHAGATRVRFSTRVDEARGQVLLSIVDNGRGMAADLRQGNGLRGMRRRAERISADIDWRASEEAPVEGGTELLLWLPLHVDP
ncbi:sensor histidine kinase [Roseateles sp. UC29_93]|uniref:sensor histidine kinase n=1 Tax=Roseateles sp. UC29_93 TaxID=3350177 RepID=UPI00367273F4